MGSDFRGEVADYYAQYRRGYPTAAVEAIVDAFGLGGEDIVLDLGCGTGQLSLPLAARVRAVMGVDPELDMLRLARRTAQERSAANISWVLGADSDLPALGRVLGDQSIGAVTIAVAIHWMERDSLFREARPLLRPGGGVAVVTNGTPMWLQDSSWSRSLRRALEELTGRPATGACQTDEAGRALNQRALLAAGYRFTESTVDYDATLTIDQVIGGMFSAMSPGLLLDRDEFAAQIRRALAGHEPITEHVRVWLQFGHVS